MDKIALVKKQVIEAEWADKISQCRESGLTVPVPVMTVPEESHNVKVNIGDITAEIPEAC